MKRCPTCKRAFDDDTLSFCLEDGSPLVAEASSRSDSQETLVSPRMPGITPDSGLAQTQIYNQQPGQAPPGTSPYGGSPGSSYGPPAGQRKTWPWVVGIGGILLLVVAAIIVVAVVLPGRLGPSANGNRPVPSPTRQNWASPSPKPSDSSDVPTDSDEVQDQLTKLEREWTEANIKGDKEALEKILADEYVGNDEDSSTKRKYIDSLKPDPSVEQWEISDVSVAQTGERAVVSAHLKQETSGGTENYDFIDTFIWRDHRWQAVSSHTTRVK
jgi:hypothetical protein